MRVYYFASKRRVERKIFETSWREDDIRIKEKHINSNQESKQRSENLCPNYTTYYLIT